MSDGHFSPGGHLSERYWITRLAVRSVQLLPFSSLEKNLPSFTAKKPSLERLIFLACVYFLLIFIRSISLI